LFIIVKKKKLCKSKPALERNEMGDRVAHVKRERVKRKSEKRKSEKRKSEKRKSEKRKRKSEKRYTTSTIEGK
jgi:hypothetical protein